ncbi:MAG: hypothetical protein WA252_15515 [Candidatus Sulfotelmatobacter sp.]
MADARADEARRSSQVREIWPGSLCGDYAGREGKEQIAGSVQLKME